MTSIVLDPREELAYTLGVQALLWGRPLIEYEITTAASSKVGAALTNGFRYFDDLKTAADRFVVTPNNVSIDGYGVADLREEPLVISVPALSDERWYIVQISDFFDEIVTNIAGNAGPQPGLYLLTGPDYSGPVPFGMKQIELRTFFAALGLRVYANGTADLEGARALQRGVRALPLSVFQDGGLAAGWEGEPQAEHTPIFEPSAPEELRQIEHLGFGMSSYLPVSLDFADPFVVSLRQIGLTVRRGFEWSGLDESTRRGLARAVPAAEAIIDWAYTDAATVVDGWRYTSATGRAGHNWPLRAAFVKNLLGANVPEQLVYPNSRVDAAGDPLDGANRYTLHFAADALPPASVLWNLAMYDPGELFIENDFGRYTIGSTTDGLHADDDGGITIVIQADEPEDTSNWLPAPRAPFNLTLRLYGAATSFLDGSWRIPPVRKE